MTTKYEPPAYSKRAFNCPHCQAFAMQNWSNIAAYIIEGHPITGRPRETEYMIKNTKLAFCSQCEKYSIWIDKKMVYPDCPNIPMVNPDLPDDIKDDYNEAGSILNKSPRGAAALLRLAIQKICMHLGEKGKNLNDDIGELVKKGLPPTIQKSLDSVRVIGNDAVHPGQIDIKDDQKTAISLFKLVNIIAEDRITRPKEIQDIYNGLPKTKIEAIEKRDNKE